MPMIEKKAADDPCESEWDSEQRGALVTLIEIQPDLSEIVDDRAQRHKFWGWAQRLTRAIVEFLKWGAMIGGAIGILKAGLNGWLR